jgi:catalase
MGRGAFDLSDDEGSGFMGLIGIEIGTKSPRAIPGVRCLAMAMTAVAIFALVGHSEEPKTGGKSPNITTDTGKPVGDDRQSMTAGPQGPTLLQDFYLIEKLAHFDRERIPERVVHARGAGVHGEFVCTNDVTALTRAKFLAKVGKKTPIFTRFSTVVLPKGSPDTARDIRGFAVKFYTEEGNYDLVGIHVPVFFIRDAIKFPDLIHALKPSPVTNVQEPDRFFDFFSAMPETTHMLTFLFSDLGTPASFREIDGFGVNTFKWVNAEGNVRYIKYRWKSAQGVRTMTDAKAKMAGGKEPATLTKDLYDSVEAGKFPSWELQVQAIRAEDFGKFDFDPLDDTKLWPESIIAFRPVGQLTLNRIPDNFFEMSEQVAFNTGAYVPGIEPSEDKLLQGRNFSYSDTQRHRLGPNYQQLPVNRPLDPVKNDNQEGLADHNHRKGDINYEPSTKEPNRLGTNPSYQMTKVPLHGSVDYTTPAKGDDFKQAGDRIRGMDVRDREHLLSNLTGEFKKVKRRDVVAKQIVQFYRADAAFGAKLAEANSVDLAKLKHLAEMKPATR